MVMVVVRRTWGGEDVAFGCRWWGISLSVVEAVSLSSGRLWPAAAVPLARRRDGAVSVMLRRPRAGEAVPAFAGRRMMVGRVVRRGSLGWRAVVSQAYAVSEKGLLSGVASISIMLLLWWCRDSRFTPCSPLLRK